MSKEVAELLKRVRLTEKEIQGIWDTDEGWISWVQYGEAVAEAQIDKVLNDPDLALIDRDAILRDIGFTKFEGSIAKMLNAGYKKVIPLAEALKEVE